jgi:3-deoxy-D-manno-octulosonate 8-phosphate phosphatase KdsC-like HAD superfamily phosphatase
VSESGAGVAGGDVPVDLALGDVDGVLPDGQLAVENVDITDAALQALAGSGPTARSRRC